MGILEKYRELVGGSKPMNPRKCKVNKSITFNKCEQFFDPSSMVNEERLLFTAMRSCIFDDQTEYLSVTDIRKLLETDNKKINYLILARLCAKNFKESKRMRMGIVTYNVKRPESNFTTINGMKIEL